MANYQLMYAKVCGAASEALEELMPSPTTINAISILKNALEEAEELYLNSE